MGMIHIYCGDGKGKTTAALGLALRAVGSGMRVHIVQLLKGSDTSELHSLQLLSGITISRCDKNYGFTFNMSDDNKKELTACHNRLLLQAEKLCSSGCIDMLIIDEFNAAFEYGLLDRELAERIVFEKPKDLELVLTGRNPDEKFIRQADYISDIKSVKHPYKNGIKARKGIEF